MDIYSSLVRKIKNGRKCFAVLIDPDNYNESRIRAIARHIEEASIDFIFYGGSLLLHDHYENHLKLLRKNTTVPVVLFPGNNFQVHKEADAILLLSLISGRNPDLLIGQHVTAAPNLKTSKLEIIPTGYMLIESGKPTAVSYMSNTTPIPSDQDEIAVCTAMAGEMLGLKLIYMDAGSGGTSPVSLSMIRKVRKNISLPLIIGGGIKSTERAIQICNAGADMIVVGNAIENDPELVSQIAGAVHSIKK
jgi:phosphoglycerol geranylgeranyltransferase